MTADEKQLNSIISSGNIEGLFLLYGKELFLTKMYATKIISKTLGKDYIDLNYTELKGNPDPDKLEELVMGLPVFADKKVVSLSDFNPEESNADEIKKYINIF